MKIDPKHIAFANLVIRTATNKYRDRGVIRHSDREDIASELMTQLLEVWEQFDPKRGTREAFINQVVNTRLVSILRERHSGKRRAKTEPIKADDERLADRTWFGKGWLRQIDLRVDLAIAFSKLTPKQRAICDQLLREALSPAAKAMGVPRSTLRDAVVKIRDVFRDAGLEEYL